MDATLYTLVAVETNTVLGTSFPMGAICIALQQVARGGKHTSAGMPDDAQEVTVRFSMLQ